MQSKAFIMGISWTLFILPALLAGLIDAEAGVKTVLGLVSLGGAIFGLYTSQRHPSEFRDDQSEHEN